MKAHFYQKALNSYLDADRQGQAPSPVISQMGYAKSVFPFWEAGSLPLGSPCPSPVSLEGTPSWPHRWEASGLRTALPLLFSTPAQKGEGHRRKRWGSQGPIGPLTGTFHTAHESLLHTSWCQNSAEERERRAGMSTWEGRNWMQPRAVFLPACSVV